MLLEKKEAEHTREIEQAEQRGYLRGRNEAIELKMEEWQLSPTPEILSGTRPGFWD